MANASVKTDSILNDKMKFRTQMIDGKPQIFFDADDPATKTKSKRNSRANNNTTRLTDQQKNKTNNKTSPTQNGINKQKTKSDYSTTKVQVNEDGSTLGVYMTMDELAELVKAVKENATNDTKPNAELRNLPPPPPPPLLQPPSIQNQHTEKISPPMVPKLELPSEHAPARISPREQVLSIMAEKKRQKWLRERAEIERLQMEIEYDQLKHQLSPRHKTNSVSPERSTFQYDFPPTNDRPPPVPSVPPQQFKSNENTYNISPKVTENPNNDTSRTQLLEKKQQKWKQDNMEKMSMWHPFGRPGGGAPNTIENQQQIAQKPPNNTTELYRPPMQQSHNEKSPSSFPSTNIHSEQSHIPAAMRRNLLFGDVRFEEDVKTAKEIERRQWLEDLQRQVEDNKHKKYGAIETDRRQDFLHENVQPLVQEAAQRHQQINDRTSEYNDPIKSERRAQLFDKLRRHGYPADSIAREVIDAKQNGSVSNQSTGEKLFGPTYDSTSTQNPSNRVEALHLNVTADRQQTYRPLDARRDEAVNTVDSTFRSDHGVQTDPRLLHNRPSNPYSYDSSDLPPQVPNHHHRNSNYRDMPNQSGKTNPRHHSHEDNYPSRRTSTLNHRHSNDDDTLSQISNQRNGPVDINNRPIWNYKNPKHREYIPNSKRDPHYEKRQRLKHFEQGEFDRIDDVQKKICYNRWNSDSELQQQQKRHVPSTRVRSTTSKMSMYGNNKDENIFNLLKIQNKHQQENLTNRKASSLHTKTDDERASPRGSSLDKYDNYVPTNRIEEVYDRTKISSPSSHSRDTSPHKELFENHTNDNYQQRELDNLSRQMPSMESPQYNSPQPNQPQSRQEHILQQLSAIKENLIRRQRELAC